MKIKELDEDGFELFNYTVNNEKQYSKKEIEKEIIQAYLNFKNGLSEKYIDTIKSI